MLKEAGIDEARCLFTNVVNERPPGNNMSQFFYPHKEAPHGSLVRGLHPMPNVVAGVRKVENLIKATRPEMVIGFGNYALWALTEDCFGIANGLKKEAGRKIPTGIGYWRGSQLRTRVGEVPFMPTYHPAACLRQWSWRYNVVQDLATRTKRLAAWDEPPMMFYIPERDDVDGCVRWLTELLHDLDAGPKLIAIDLETRAGHIACFGMADSDSAAMCIPFMQAKTPYSYWEPQDELRITELLRNVLVHPNLRIVGQNFLYDAQYIWRFFGVVVKIFWDTRILQSVLYPGTPAALYYLASLYCRHHRYWKDDGKEWDKKMDERVLWLYNCRDCVKTFEVAQVQTDLIIRYDLMTQYGIQRDRLDMYLEIMLRGVRVDPKRRLDITVKLMEAKLNYDAYFERMIPENVYPRDAKKSPWWTSPAQTGELFYDVLGVREIISRATGNRTVDDEALERIGHREPLLHHLVTALQEFRSITAFEKFVNAKVDNDGRMRCFYTPTTETYRSSSSQNAFDGGGNLQNIPKGSEEKE